MPIREDDGCIDTPSGQLQAQFESQLSELQQNMLSRKVVIYDCETVKCIPTGDRSPKLESCQGRDDFKGMGIAVIDAYSSWDNRYHRDKSTPC